MPDFSNHPLRKRYNLDSAMSTIWEFYRKWFIPLFIISFISSLVTTVIASRIDLSGLQSMNDPFQMIEAIRPYIGTYLLTTLIGLVFALVLQYFVIIKPLEDGNESSGWILHALGRFLLPLAVVYIILSLFAVMAIFVGLVALIIGALFSLFYVMIFFTLAAPVMIIENASIPDTIKRVFSLGHKKFGINIGWVAIFVVLFLIISIVLSAIVMIPFTGGFLKSLVNPESAAEITEFAKRPAYILLSSLAGAIATPFYPIFSLVLYFNATSYEEGSFSDSKSNQDGGNGVTLEDLYGSAYNKNEKGSGDQGNERRPTVEDLAP
jgi:hypothetical protein